MAWYTKAAPARHGAALRMELFAKLLTDPVAAAIGFGTSVALFGLGILLVPIVIAQLPADHFVRVRPSVAESSHPVVRVTLRVLKNLLGAFLVLIGIAMLVLPGQGVLTILIGLTLVDFPGKRRFQRRLLRLPGVFRVVSAIRRRAKRPPLVLDVEDESEAGVGS